MKNIFFEFFRISWIFKSYFGYKIYLNFFLYLVAGFLETVGILILIPLLEGLDLNAKTDNPNVNFSSMLISKLYFYLGLEKSLFGLLLSITTIFIIKGIISFTALGYSQYLKGKFSRILKENIFLELSSINYKYYLKKNTGNFINVINEQVYKAILSFQQFSSMIWQLTNSIFYLGFAILVGWGFGVLAVIFAIFIIIFFKYLSTYTLRNSRKSASENSFLTDLLVQSIQGYKYLLATNQTKIISKNIFLSIKKLSILQIKIGIANSFTSATKDPLAVIFISILIAFEVGYLNKSIAPILVSMLLFYRGLSSVLTTQVHWQSTLEFIGSLYFINKEFNNYKANKESNGSIKIKRFTKKIEFQKVSFKYEKYGKSIISNLSFSLNAKESIAFVGPSGAGKSTIVDLIITLLMPDSGNIKIDGLDIDKIEKNSWRSQIGYVSQEAVIFNDSIANNICMGEEDFKDKNVMRRIRNAAKKANLDSFINSLEEGYETIVGDRGSRLSGGQKQRLFIARELFRNPQILIFDEATSALDSQSELAIQKSIESIKGDRTVIIISHRLSTITNVDKIYVLDNGSIIEEGNYKELSSDEDSKFSQFVNLQKI